LEQSAGVSTGVAVTASFSQQTEDVEIKIKKR